jgi:hypothetical protein
MCVGAEVRVCAAADAARRAAELVAAAVERRDALVATGVMPAGVWL